MVDDLRSAGPRPADPRLAELRAAAQALRRELAGYRGDPADLRAAEEGLDAVDAHLLAGEPDGARLRGALLLLVGALGSVSALSGPVGDVRRAIDRITGKG
ncbi:hypothetical protein GQS52_05420 [Streptomyces sp. SCUT-3]|uniref:DUF5955 family protein n=1 Tax=Streptomyces TaxID=1883 RepID=UPI0015FBA21D|nr:DUF5955 family protein [Streptomyces sp. SCUT-3]QMV21301.1 hypothetical protein GQS52_05420 [Streptomyces sp. SCUT-3]